MNELPMRVVLYLGIGLGVGSLSGTLGIGGGVLLVPVLIGLCQFEPARAAGTSLAVLMIPVCMPAAWKAFTQDRVDWEAALCIAAAFAVGAYGGATLVPYLPEQTLSLLFGLLLTALGLRLLYGHWLSDAEPWLAWCALVLIGVAGLASRLLVTRPGSARTEAGVLDYHI